MRFLKYLIFLLTIPAFAQGSHRFDTVLTRGNGVAANIVPYATVRVCVPSTGCVTLQPIFLDVALTQPAPNPISADASGNFSYYYAPGCVDEQYSSPAMGLITRKNICISNGGGGGNPGGTPQSAQFQINSSTFGGSKATFDANGDLVTLSTNTIPDAFLNQTTHTSNNGITRELTAGNTVGSASGSYPNVEFPGGAGTFYWRTPYGTGGIEGLPPAIGSNSLLIDNRINSYGTVFYNPNPNWPNEYNVSLMDDTLPISGQAGQWTFGEDFQVVHCCGFNDENFDTDQTVFNTRTVFLATQAGGISSGLNVSVIKPASGDNQILGLFSQFSNATVIPSDEGNEAIRIQDTQSTFPAVFNLSTATTRGNPIVPLTNISGWLPGEGTFLVIPTQAGPVLHATAITSPRVGGLSNPGTITVLETLTPDVVGSFPENINTPASYKGGTTNATITMTGVTGAFVSNSTFPTACVANSQYSEEAKVVSVGTLSGGSQTITLALRHSYNFAGQTGIVSQGVNACKGLEALANQAFGYQPSTNNCPTSPIGHSPCPIRQMSKVIAVISPHVIQYANPLASGGWDTVQFGSVFPSGTVPAALLTRSANVTTLNITGLNFPSASKDNILVSGCSDPSFNGTFGPVTQVGATLTWPNTGANGSTTGCNPIAFMSFQGNPANGFRMMPAPVVVQAENPATKDQTAVVTEANNYLPTTSDELEAQPGGEVALVTHQVDVGMMTPSSGSFKFTDYNWVANGLIPDGLTLFNYSFGAYSPQWLVGGGGTRQPQGTVINLQSDPGLFSGWIHDDGGPPSNAQLFSTANCGAFACNDPSYQGWFLFNQQFDSGLGNFSLQILPSADQMKMSIGGGASSGGFTTIQQTATSISLSNSGSAISSLNVGSGIYDLVQGGVLSGTNFFSEEKFLLNSWSLQMTNQATGAQVTASQSFSGWSFSGGANPVPTSVDELTVGVNQTFVGVQGTAGTKIAAASGTFTSGNLRSTNGTGDEVDAGVAVSALPAQIASTTVSIGGSALAAGACSTGTATIAGGTIGHTVGVSTSDGTDIGGSFFYRGVVTNNTTVTVSVCAAVAGTPTAKTYNVTTY